jgi:hypothetical protein
MSESSAGRSTAAVVRDRVMRSSGKFVRAEDFKGPRGAVLRELSRRVEAGDLRHVQKGLYWRGQETMLGMAPPAPLELVQELVGVSGVGPAESSAALALGLSTQHPRREMFAVPTRPPTCADARLALKDRSAREGRRAQKLNSNEVAVLEVLADWPRLIELPREQAVERLVRVVSSDAVRPAKLARAAKDEPAVVRESLRGLLVKGGLEAAQLIPPAYEAKVRDRALVVA